MENETGHVDRDLPAFPHTDQAFSTSGRHTRSHSEHAAAGLSRRRSNRDSNAKFSLRDDPYVKELKDIIHKLTTQLQIEKTRADDADRRAAETIAYLKNVNDARLSALQDAERANQQLKLYRIQLETAQQEIFRAQETVDVIDRQRQEAEEAAANGRSTIRKLNQDRMIRMAHEEGRKMGLQEGLQTGRDVRFEEGRMMGLEEAHSLDGDRSDDSYEEDHGYHDDVDASTFQTRPRSVAQSEFQPHSVAQSYRGHQAPTPPPPHSQTSPAPVPIPPPVHTQPFGQSLDNEIHPRSIRGVSPTPRMSHAPIPPDNYIPQIGADNVIRIPPPHEFHRPPPTPERAPSPSLPPAAESSRPNTPHQSSRAHPQFSPASSSANLSVSRFDLVSRPEATHNSMRTPMSAIPEVRTPSPHSVNGARSLNHQPSLVGSSTHRMNTSTPRLTEVLEHPSWQQGQYSRPRSRASSTTSFRSPQAMPRQVHRTSDSSFSVPDVNIQPPSRPPSLGTPRGAERLGERLSPADASRPISLPDETSHRSSGMGSQPLSGTQLPRGFVPTGFTQGTTGPAPLPNSTPFQNAMPGAYDASLYTSQEGGPAVIPPSEMRGHASDASDSDEVASIIGSTLSTTPSEQQAHHDARSEAQARGARIWNEATQRAIHSPPASSEADWSSAIRMASHMPMLPSSMHRHLRPGSNQNRSRPQSRGTDRTDRT